VLLARAQEVPEVEAADNDKGFWNKSSIGTSSGQAIPKDAALDGLEGFGRMAMRDRKPEKLLGKLERFLHDE